MISRQRHSSVGCAGNAAGTTARSTTRARSTSRVRRGAVGSGRGAATTGSPRSGAGGVGDAAPLAGGADELKGAAVEGGGFGGLATMTNSKRRSRTGGAEPGSSAARGFGVRVTACSWFRGAGSATSCVARAAGAPLEDVSFSTGSAAIGGGLDRSASRAAVGGAARWVGGQSLADWQASEWRAGGGANSRAR